MGDGAGGLWRVFDPKWWQIWRWWSWFWDGEQHIIELPGLRLRVLKADRALAPWLAPVDATTVALDRASRHW